MANLEFLFGTWSEWMSFLSFTAISGNAELWTDMAEWLILRGARRIVISSDSKPQQTHVNRRLSLLQTYFNADIIFSSNKAQTRDTAAELLSEVYFLGPIHAVFVLPLKSSSSKISDTKSVQHIDIALRTTAPKAMFVNFIQPAAGFCQLRADSGFATYNIQWDNSLEFADALSGLDDILNSRLSNTFVKNDRVSDVDQESMQALFKKLQLLLPTSIDDLRKEVRYAPVKPEFVQLPTLGPRTMRELPALFIIPGLSNEKTVAELADQLLYPVFCASLPFNSMSLQDTAVELAEKMKEIYPRGPYNILGVSWGGSLAIEIARLLERKGATTLLYFIDAAPETIQAALKHLGEGVPAEVNLISRILNINNPDVINTLNSLPSWEKRVVAAVEHYSNGSESDGYLETALTTIKQRLEDVAKYSPTDELVAAGIHLLRPAGSSKYDNCGLLKYCKQTAQIYIVQGDHQTIITSKTTADIVNEKVIV